MRFGWRLSADDSVAGDELELLNEDLDRVLSVPMARWALRNMRMLIASLNSSLLTSNDKSSSIEPLSMRAAVCAG